LLVAVAVAIATAVANDLVVVVVEVIGVQYLENLLAVIAQRKHH
jgi:hypothetical protein